MSGKIEWHEVPGNPGMILIGNDDLKIPVYCELAEKTEWTCIEAEYKDVNNEMKEYFNFCGRGIKVYYPDNNEEFEIYSGYITIFTGKGRIVFLKKIW